MGALVAKVLTQPPEEHLALVDLAQGQGRHLHTRCLSVQILDIARLQ